MTDEVLTLGESEVGHAGLVRWSRALQASNQGVEVVWRGLRNDWLLIGSGLAILLVTISAYALRQMPGQLADDPLAATRWLMTTSAEYGWLGDLLRGLGLFDLPHSLVLHLLLALLGLILFVRLGDLLAAGWHYQRLANQMTSPATESGAPLALPLARFRWRQAAAMPVVELSPRLRDYLTVHFDQVKFHALDLPAAATEQLDPEIRLLAIRQRWGVLLQPLAFIGLLLLWVVLWLILSAGWTVMPPALAPGAEYHYAPHEFTLHYRVDPQTQGATPQLEVQVGQRSQRLPATSKGYRRLGQVDVETTPGPPGLLLSTPGGQPLLRRPGQRATVAAVGLTFPNPGSEESLILTQTVVLRIVRLADDNAFAIEVYQGKDQQPGQRLQINKTETAPLLINGQTINLHFALLPSLQVEASYLPGIWLSWLALVLLLIGAVGFWFRPAFVLIQIAPWPEKRSVLVAQGDRADVVEALRQWAVISHQ